MALPYRLGQSYPRNKQTTYVYNGTIPDHTPQPATKLYGFMNYSSIPNIG
jgi:hypothetical protein